MNMEYDIGPHAFPQPDRSFTIILAGKGRRTSTTGFAHPTSWLLLCYCATVVNRYLSRPTPCTRYDVIWINKKSTLDTAIDIQ